MSRKGKDVPATEIKLQIDTGLAVDLDALCMSIRGRPPRVRIIREAIRDYVERALKDDAELAHHFSESKAAILAKMETTATIRLLRPGEKEGV